MEGEIIRDQQQPHDGGEGFFDGDDDDIIGWFDDVAENLAAEQTLTLRRILKRNCGVEYLRKWIGDVDICHVADSELESLYTKLVPLATYDDFQPFIQRMIDGEKTLLTQQPITCLSQTSGTSGRRPKYIPFVPYCIKTDLQAQTLAKAFILRDYPIIREGSRSLDFLYSNKLVEQKGPTTIASATTHIIRSEDFSKSFNQIKRKSTPCSPLEVISNGDFKKSTYCHLVLGLFFSKQVESVTAVWAYTLVQIFTSFQDLWSDLCDDIRQGTLNNERVSNCPEMRKAVLDIIYPNPSLALRIEETCNELKCSNWFGLIPSLWPNAKYIWTIVTGSMRPHLKKLKHYSGNLQLITQNYASSESEIGINTTPCSLPENVCYTIIPTASYFEFIPLYGIEESCVSNNIDYIEEKPISLSQVKVGQKYEIVLTTYGGLYRYKLGDIVEVVGFYKNSPKLNFIRRRNLSLSVASEKITEESLMIVVERVSELLISKAKNAELINFTSHANVRDQPGHYVIYWEIKGYEFIDDDILQECCNEMDVMFPYGMLRKNGDIGPLELCIVERDTFAKIFEYFLEKGGSVNQFKDPKCTDNQGVLEIFRACTFNKFRSTAYM